MRTRKSLQEMVAEHKVDPKPLDDLVRAFYHIQRLPPDDPNSFFRIAGYHGEPFRGPGITDGSAWWGGYCNHNNVLFPTWHRAYLLRLEDALRSVPGCSEVTLPFWDECFELATEKERTKNKSPEKGSFNPIPTILTDPKYLLDGVLIDNPLYSYKLARTLDYQISGGNKRYFKAKDYETVRYPKSGLVGTTQDRMYTDLHNAKFGPTAEESTSRLNENVANWLLGTVDIPDDGSGTRRPDTYSVYARYLSCLNAPNYTVMSNRVSETQWNSEHASNASEAYVSGTDPSEYEHVYSLESPHDAIHLALGGFYQEGTYDADPIKGANGDMGCNETAGFDPIFYFHHCFIDYVLWTWQKIHGCTLAGSLDVLEDYPGTVVDIGMAGVTAGTVLSMDTPLVPFKKEDQKTYYTSHDVTNIEDLGYEYGHGSLDPYADDGTPFKGIIGADDSAKIVRAVKVHNINRAQISGSFVVRVFATTSSGKVFEIGRDAILSRWIVQGCANCQNSLGVQVVVPIDSKTFNTLREGSGDSEHEPVIFYHTAIQTHDTKTSFKDLTDLTRLRGHLDAQLGAGLGRGSQRDLPIAEYL